MNHSRSSNRPRFIIALIVIVFLAALEWFAPHIMPSLFHAIARPFWRIEYGIQSGILSSEEKLLAENARLKRELEDVEVRIRTVRQTEIENEELKALLGREVFIDNASSTDSTATGFVDVGGIRRNAASIANRILAPVLARPPLSAYDVIVIDGGQDMNFKNGDKVFSSARVPIGRIVDVYSQTSKVVLYTSPGERYDVLVGSSTISAVAVGMGGGEYRAELPRRADVTQGDFVVVPSIFDRPIGVVKGIVSDSASAFETILIAPTVNIYDMKWVMVEKTL